ncbi:MAG: MotA/TolQ/ExbB proton channel family protein [bacterium]
MVEDGLAQQPSPVQSPSVVVPAQGGAPAAAGAVTKISDIRTFWSLTKMGGGISVAIFAVMAIGLFLIVMQVYELVMDKIKGRPLLVTNYRQMSVSDINKLVMSYPDSMTARLYSVLLSIFHTTGNTRDFHDEIANYLQLQQERFNTFKSRLAFLSDTAGALGLLGTVWGMFVTFFGGNLDSQRILNGMGLALITTLIGLVVSIILNFCATEVFGVFNKRLEVISAKADEFRLWLMALVQQRSKRAGETAGGNGGHGHREQKEPHGANNPGRPKVPSFQLKAVSDFQQDGTIGRPLRDRVTIMVETEKGQKISGMPIRYEVVDGGGTLENHKTAAIVKTDRRGMVSFGWTLGKEVGPQKLRVSVPNFDDHELEFVSFAQPYIPNLTAQKVDIQTGTINVKRGMVA